MTAVVYLCLALLGSSYAQQYGNDGDDGSYNAEKYEKPYEYNPLAVNQQQYQQPQYQPQAQYQQPQYQPQAQYQSQPQPQYSPQPQAQYQQPQYQPQAQPQYSPQPQVQPQYQPTTPQPRRVYPPGKLSLNRSPDGYSYSFSST